MDSLGAEMRRPTVGPFLLPFYYGWVNVVVAALAMVGTLPGRTQGLGLITETLLADLQIDRVVFARINFWATLVGALFCVGVGRLIDRFGSRVVLTVVTVALGIVVLCMSGVRGVAAIALLITLTRGLGQSALSVISITIVGKWFVRQINLAMAVYTIVLSVGFMLAFPVIGAMVIEYGWRTTWSVVGLTLLPASHLSGGSSYGEHPKRAACRLTARVALKTTSATRQPATRWGKHCQHWLFGSSAWPVPFTV